MQPGLSGTLWPAHPKPLPDELLSSWMVRIAGAHGLKLHTFASAVWPGVAIWNRDIDRSATEPVLRELALRTATTYERVEAMTLRAYESYVFENLAANSPLLLPVGIYHRTRRLFGQQCCVKCLAEDETPYFRRKWRLAFVTICSRHQIELIDRCPLCAAPIVFIRSELGERARFNALRMTRCHNCERSILRSRVKWYPANASLVEATRFFEKAVDEGTVPIAGAPVYSHLFFAGLRGLMQLCLSRGFGQQIDAELRSAYRLPAKPIAPSNGLTAEFLATKDRSLLVVLAWLLVKDWPHRFLAMAETVGLTASSVLAKGPTPPHWFWAPIAPHLDKSAYSPPISELRAAIAAMKRAKIVPTVGSVASFTGYKGWHYKRKLYRLVGAHK
jgi:hypothetical protein